MLRTQPQITTDGLAKAANAQDSAKKTQVNVSTLPTGMVILKRERD
jgi:hypothetical protein